MQGLCVTDVTSRQTLRFGKIRLLGNLEKLLEANAIGIETKFKSELAVPSARRSLSGSGTDVHRSWSGVFCGASDVEKTAVGRASGPGNRAGRDRAPGAGSELRGWCIVSNLSRAPGVLRAHPISTPASDGPPERAGDRLRPAAGPGRADRLRDGHAAEDRHNGPERRRTAGVATSRTRSSGRSTARFRGGPLHGPAAGHPDRLEGRDLHGHAGRCAKRTSRRRRTRSRHPVRETSFKTCAYNVSQPVREVSLQGRLLHGLPARPGDRLQDGQLHGLPAVQETCYKTCVYTVCRPVQKVRTRCVPYTVRCRCSRP